LDACRHEKQCVMMNHPEMRRSVQMLRPTLRERREKYF
jgi:hypothetical protein